MISSRRVLRPLLVSAALAGCSADAGNVGPMQGPVPQATVYFPTLAIAPAISPTVYQCLGRPAPVIGNTGILDAVARHLTNMGTRTVATDFVRPWKFGGTIIWWAYAAGGPTTRQGAEGIKLTASAGQLVPVQWGCPPTAVCPPGPAFPPAGLSSRSPRNFYVLPPAADGGMTPSNIGVNVILLPPAASPPTVAFTLTDPVTDPAQNRPFAFLPLPNVTAVPGKIVFGETQARPGTDWEPAGYECAEYSKVPGTGALLVPPPSSGAGGGGGMDAGSPDAGGETGCVTHECCGMCHVGQGTPSGTYSHPAGRR